MRHFKSLFIAALLSVLSGCATFNVAKDYALDNKPASGLLVTSFTHTTQSMVLAYRSKDGKTGTVMTGNIQDPLDWTGPNGRLVVIELASGDYEFVEWRSQSGNMLYTSKPFSIPFSVSSGKATYIGNIHVAMVEFTGLYKVGVVDKKDRDLPLLHSKYPKLRATDVVTSISTATTTK